ncbi:hypothetical protein BJV82DRAFT_162987 [Fennellomyces sp. T-0311]|nr:hypothetical protein BJV82DRAFT_162987 [Fennellomyces sp. T-0311]
MISLSFKNIALFSMFLAFYILGGVSADGCAGQGQQCESNPFTSPDRFCCKGYICHPQHGICVYPEHPNHRNHN